jgi:thiamine biosynthesis protein ThiS
MQETIRLTVNGEERSFAAPQTVESLLAALGLDCRKIAIERNEEIVPRGRYAATPLASGDAVEIVHFIGGG